MRKVFTSARLENVEAVAELLRKNDIEVRISEGRSYRGNRRSTFSYREEDQPGPQPAVWILNADDQPRGRQLLRDAGLLESTRAGESSYLPLSSLHDAKGPAAGKTSNRTKVRLGLLVLIVIVSALIWYSRVTAPDEPATQPDAAIPSLPAKPAPPAIIPQQVGDLVVYRADVPTALAKLLVEREIAVAKPAQACITIDGGDPAPRFIESLALGEAIEAYAASDCPGDAALTLAVHDYMTDGSGQGRVQLDINGGAPRTIQAERDGTRWEIVSTN